MLPITTAAVWEEIREQRATFALEEMLRDIGALESENPHLAVYVETVLMALKDTLRHIGFAEETAEDLALLGIDICVMLYTALRKQAERDRLPPLPKVGAGLVQAFRERSREVLLKPPIEKAKALERDPFLLGNTWIVCNAYSRVLEQEAAKEKVPPERVPGVANAAFGFACGLYELLEEAEQVEEMEKLLKE